MPYFKCPRCALRAYSAASESRCPSCDSPLRREHQLDTLKPASGRFRPAISARVTTPFSPETFST